MLTFSRGGWEGNIWGSKYEELEIHWVRAYSRGFEWIWVQNGDDFEVRSALRRASDPNSAAWLQGNWVNH